MKSQRWTILKSLAIPLLVGGLAGFLTRDGMELFAVMKKPPLSPPGFLFPLVWTVLYVLMGLAAYLIRTADAPENQISDALTVYWVQLVINFLWPVFFFDYQWYLFSFFWLLFLWVLIILMIKSFSKIVRTAAYLCVPYLVWVTFAGYLNVGIWWLNRGVA